MMGFSLIVAIGAQNAFILRQGLRGEHVFAICLECAVSDALLITLGVSSFRHIVHLSPAIEPLMRHGGALFLFCYGAKSLFAAARSSDALVVGGGGGAASLTKTMTACVALTWLNPHVYLDSVMLMGTISTQFPGREFSFAAGGITASVLFFFALGYGAGRLRPLFAKPSSWRLLETVVAGTMWSIAAKLVIGM